MHRRALSRREGVATLLSIAGNGLFSLLTPFDAAVLRVTCMALEDSVALFAGRQDFGHSQPPYVPLYRGLGVVHFLVFTKLAVRRLERQK